MFHSDTDRKTIWVSDYDVEAGMPSSTRLFALVEAPDGGGPDGVAAIDRDGFPWWCVVFGGGRLLRLDPGARVGRTVVMPVQCPTMPALGGPDLSTVYVTSACWRIDKGVTGGRPLEGNPLAFEASCRGLPATRLAGEFA